MITYEDKDFSMHMKSKVFMELLEFQIDPPQFRLLELLLRIPESEQADRITTVNGGVRTNALKCNSISVIKFLKT
jgi:hypothetical protein